MATGYWRGATNSTWDLTSNWWTTIGGTTTVAAVPGSSDTAFFNANGTTTARDVYLNGSRSVGTLSFNSNNGGIGFTGGTFGAVAANTLTLGSGGIDMSSSGGNVNSYSSVTLSIANANTPISVASGRGAFVDGVVSGVGGWLHNGAGYARFNNGSSTYSGGTSISAGFVGVGASTTGAVTSGPLGTGTITMTGGALLSDGTTARTLANALSLNGTMTLGDATNTGALTFSGTTTIAGTTTLTAQGNNHTFSGTFGGTGAFGLAGGTIVLTGASGSKSGGTTLSGGSIIIGYSVANVNQLGSDAIVINSGEFWVAGTSSATFANTITGSGGVLWTRNRNASGITFTNAGAYAGIARIYAGSDDGAGVTAQSMTFTAFPQSVTDFTYYNNNSVTVTQTIKYNGSSNVATNASVTSYTPVRALNSIWNHAPSTASATMSVGGAIISNVAGAHTFEAKNDATGLLSFTGGGNQVGAGAMAFSKTGSGPVTLSGTFNHTGTVQVTAGTLNANSTTALGADTSSGTVSSGATLSLGAALNYSTRTFTISGTGVSTGGALVHAFAGTAKIGAITLGAASYIRGTASGTSTLSSSIANGGFALTVGGAAFTSNTLTLTGGISGLGGLVVGTVNDGSKVALPTANTYQGNTTLSYGTLSLGNASALGSVGTLVFNGGRLDASVAGLTVANAITASADVYFQGTNALTLSGPMSLGASRLFWVAGTLTMSGVISGTGYSIDKQSAGTLVLTNANTYTGGTTLSDGTLQVGNNAALGSGTVTLSGATIDASTTVTLSNALSIQNGTIVFGGTAQLTLSSTFNISLHAVATVTTNGSGGSLILSGVVSDGGAGRKLAKAGTNTLKLTNANTYSGGTDIGAGVVQAGNTQALGTTGTVTLTANGATLQTLTTGGQNGKLTVAALTNSAGGIIRIGG